MIARIRKSMDKKDQGFTLIELLVVMIIIGILAAIAIPLFLSQRRKAEDAATKSDISIIGKEIATWYVDNTALPVITVATVGTAEEYRLGGEKIANVSTNVDIGADGVEPATATSLTWCVDATNPMGDQAAGTGATDGYKYSAAGGLEEGQC